MSYDLKVERDFLSWVELECTDEDAPSKGAVYLEPHSASSIPALEAIYSNNADTAWRKFVVVKNVALDRGWIVEQEPWSGGDRGRLRLAESGFKRLDWHREQDLIPRLGRFFQTSLGVIVVNLLLPAAVAMITVLITK